MPQGTLIDTSRRSPSSDQHCLYRWQKRFSCANRAKTPSLIRDITWFDATPGGKGNNACHDGNYATNRGIVIIMPIDRHRHRHQWLSKPSSAGAACRRPIYLAFNLSSLDRKPFHHRKGTFMLYVHLLMA